MQTPETTFPTFETRIGQGVRAAYRIWLRGVWKPCAKGALKGPPKARQALRHISKKMALLNGRANQVVRRWSRLGDRNKRVLSRHVRGVRSTTFDIGPNVGSAAHADQPWSASGTCLYSSAFLQSNTMRPGARWTGALAQV